MSVFSFYPDLKCNPCLVESTFEHCKSLIRVELNCTDKMNPTILAINKLGVPLWFSVDISGESREVECYSQGNGYLVKRDIEEVFYMIQQHCIAWCSIKENEIV